MKRRCTILALVLSILGEGPSPAAEAAPASTNLQDAILTLVLEGTLPDGKPLTVYLDRRAGRFTGGLAKSPLFSKTAHDVDASKLVRDGGKLEGPLSVMLNSDGYNPPEGRSVRCLYDVRARIDGTNITGRFEGRCDVAPDGQGGEVCRGAVSGHVAGRGSLDGTILLDLNMINAAGEKPIDAKVWQRRALLRTVFHQGKLVESIIHGHGDARQVNYFEAVVRDVDLKWDGNSLGGSVAVESTSGDRYVYTFHGKLIGGHVAGTFEKERNGADVPGGPFSGVLEPWPEIPPDEAIYNVELLGAVAGGKQLNLFVPCRRGTFEPGMGYAGTFNHMYHDVNDPAIELGGKKLRGELGVTINADAYVPRDGKPVACRYRIDAELIRGCLRGSFTGRFDEEAVSGRLLGRLMPLPPQPEPARFSLKLEDGVNEGAPWLRRVYVSFVAVDGKADRGGMSNNKGGWQGAFRRASVRLDGSTFHATIEGTVETSRGPRTGAYRFELAGRAVGSELVGNVDTYRDGKLTKQGTPFMGSVYPVE